MIISDPDGKENSRANYIGEYIVTLKGQIEYLRNEVFFFEKKITGKKWIEKVVFPKPFASTFQSTKQV